MNREDLKAYKYEREWIKEMLEYIEEQREIITKITSSLSDMPSESRQVEDKMAENIAKFLDSMNELSAKVAESNKKLEEVLMQLEKVEQPYKLILEKVYIQGKPLVTVASEMDYDYKYMCKIHGIALNKFDSSIEKTTKEVESRLKK